MGAAFLCFAFPLIAQPRVGDSATLALQQQLKISLQPIEEDQYAGETILLRAVFENISLDRRSVRLRFFDNSFEQWILRATVQTPSQVSLEPRELRPTLSYMDWQFAWQAESAPPSTREIELDPGEQFVVRLRLDEFFDLEEGVTLRIDADFYPLGFVEPSYTLAATPIELAVKLPLQTLSGTLNPTGRTLLTPEQIPAPSSANGREGRNGNNGNNGSLGFSVPQLGDRNREFLGSPPSENFSGSSGYIEGVPSSSNMGNIGSGNMGGVEPTRSIGSGETSIGSGETIARMLRAVARKDWETVLASMALSEVLESSYSSTEFFERMLTAAPNEREIILYEFMAFLTDSFDFEIRDAQILRAVEIATNAEVEALVTSVESYRQFRQTLNPLTGQVEFAWLDLITDVPLERDRIFKFYLGVFGGQWKITGFEVRLFSGSRDALRDEYVFNEDVTPPTPRFTPAARVLFEFNRADLAASAQRDLQDLAAFLALRPKVFVRLLGFTDDIGTDNYNLRLSARRVSTVGQFLINEGVSPLRIETLARGERNFLNLNQNEAERSLNRRVEIYLIPQ